MTRPDDISNDWYFAEIDSIRQELSDKLGQIQHTYTVEMDRIKQEYEQAIAKIKRVE